MFCSPCQPAAHCFTCQIEKEEQAESEKAVGKEFQREWTAPAAEGMAMPSVPIQQFSAGKESEDVVSGSTMLRLGFSFLTDALGSIF